LVVTLVERPGVTPPGDPYDRAPDIYFRLATDGTVRFVSQPCMGKPPAEVIGQSIFDVLPPEWSAQLRRQFADQLDEPRVSAGEREVVIDDRTHVFRHRIVPLIKRGNVDELVVQSWDITNSVEAAAALRVTAKQYRQLIENSLDLVGIFVAETATIRFVSPNSTELIGYRQAELLGRSLFEFIASNEREAVRQRVRNLIDGRTTVETIEVRAQHSDGRYVLLEARARLLISDRAEALIILNARDITDRHESQLLRRNLMRADKLAAIGQVAASVAHEVNNPASFITTNLHVMQDDLRVLRGTALEMRRILEDAAPERLRGLDASSPETIEEIVDEFERMVHTNLEGMERISHIVRELRSFSRADEDDGYELVDLNETIRAACNMVRNQISYLADLVEDFDDELPPVLADRGKLSQVLVNLLVNASQAIQKAPRDRQHEVRVRTSLAESFARVDVIDTGGGVDDDARVRIFDPFFTTKDEGEGTGLGLWLCKEILEKAGGTLWLEYSRESGSCFSFRLPAHSLVDIPETPFEELSSSAHEELPQARVLLVDDDELVLDSYRKILEPHHRTVVAQGGERAIAILTEDAGFDAIVCDVIMPGTDGVEVFQYLEANRPELVERTYFCTAGVFTDRTREFVRRIQDRVVHKPISARQLRALVAETVSASN
jgi:PAS domain S-box-containing protein